MFRRLYRLFFSTHRKVIAGSVAKSVFQFIFELVIPFFIDGHQSTVIIRSPEHTQRIARINKWFHILPVGPGVYHPVLIRSKAIDHTAKHFRSIYLEHNGMHTVTIVNTVHVIISLDTRSDHSPCLDGTRPIGLEGLPLRTALHDSGSRLWKQHNALSPGSSGIFYFWFEKRHRIDRFTGSGFQQVQMQVRSEWITRITAPGYLLSRLYRIFPRFGNNLYFPIFFFVLKLLHSSGNVRHKSAQVPVNSCITVIIYHIEYMSRTIGDTNTWDVSVGQRAHRFTDNSLSLKVKTAMKMIGTNFSEITAQSQCKVKWRNKSSLLHILWMSLNAAGKHQSNYILFHVVCLKMESLQKYIIPAISENRKMDFIPACHGSFIPRLPLIQKIRFDLPSSTF